MAQPAVSSLSDHLDMIFLDIDDTLLVFTEFFMDWANHRLGTAFQMDDIGDYYLGTLWGFGENEQAALEEEFLFTIGIHTAPLIEGAREVVTHLAGQVPVIGLTHRKCTWRDATMQQLERVLPGVLTDVLHIRFGNIQVPKYRLIGDRALLIDDAWGTVRAAAEAGVKVALFGDYGWNRQPFPNGIQVPHIRAWNEALPIITSLARGQPT